MQYNFTNIELECIHDLMEINGEFGPRDCFRWFHKLPTGTAIHTEDVEDFMIAFMSAYNKIYPHTY